MGRILTALLVVVIGVAAWSVFKCCTPPEPPHFDLEEWWGPKDLKGRQDTSIKPFKVKFSEEVIKDLRERIKNRRPFTPPLEGVGFEYGFNGLQLDSWLKYWAEQYPFAEREALLNKYPQFKTNIQGLDVHFIRVKPQVPSNIQVVPLLLLHGWPGSVREFYEAIPLLTQQTSGYDFVFELVIPSLPGYGFSDAAVRPGLGMAQVSVVMRNLMQRLGFKKYYVQGGDWGSGIGAAMATLFPEEILGYHSNLPLVKTGCSLLKTFIGAYIPSLIVGDHLADRMYPFSSHFAYLLEESGYMHIQSTKPDTIGVALSDSPAGLLAYILEKFSTWTNKGYRSLPDGGLSRHFSREQLVDNLMIYWSTGSITTSMRLYAESMNKKHQALKLDIIKTTVPTWGLQAKHEIMYQPPSILKSKYTNLLNVTTLEEGGHFVALELPKVFSADVFRAVKAFREWHSKNKKTEL